jgi:hypothetical protein
MQAVAFMPMKQKAANTGMPMTAQEAEEDKMRKLEEAWDKQAAAWAAQGLKPPPKGPAKGPAKQANGTLMTPEQKAAQEMVWEKQRAEWAAVQAKLESENGQARKSSSGNSQMNTEKSSMNTKKSSNMDIRSKSPDMGMNMSSMNTKKSSNMDMNRDREKAMTRLKRMNADTDNDAQNMPAKKITPWSSEMLADSMKRTGLSESITNKFYTTFKTFPQYLVAESQAPEANSNGPIFRSWGNDDWVQFVNEYTIMSDGSIDMAALKDLQRSLSFLPNADGPGSRGAKAGQVTRLEASRRYEKEKVMMARKQATEMTISGMQKEKAGQSDDNEMSGRYEEGMAMQSKEGMAAAKKKQAMAALKAGQSYDNGENAMSWGRASGMAVKSSEKQAMAPPVDVTPIISVLDKINTTLKNSLTSIEAKAKNNDVNPSLEEMNDHLLEIMASIPTQGGGGTKKKKSSAKKPAAKAKGAAKSAKPAAPPETIPLSSDPNINKVVESLNIINNTLSSTLAAIDSRIKTNNINPALATMNEYLSEISTSIPEQGGGGTRRLRVKKGKKALRNRRA